MGLSQYLSWQRVGLDTVYYPISIIEFRQSRWTTIPPNIPPDGSQYPARSLYILPSIKSQLHTFELKNSPHLTAWGGKTYQKPSLTYLII